MNKTSAWIFNFNHIDPLNQNMYFLDLPFDSLTTFHV